MIDKIKILKLVHRLELFIDDLDRRRDLAIHEYVNQWYYMQKLEELKMALSLFEDLRMRMDEMGNHINKNHEEMFKQWRKDIRWINTFLIQKQCARDC